MGVYSRNGSGLVIVEHSADEAAVARALKQHDPELELFREIDPHHSCWVWKVNRRAPDGSFEFVLGFREDGTGRPYPLSMRIVDEVQKHDRGTRGRMQTVDEATAELKAEQRRDYDRDAEAIVKEFGPKLDGKSSSPLPRSRGLQRARQRAREQRPNLPKDMQP